MKSNIAIITLLCAIPAFTAFAQDKEAATAAPTVASTVQLTAGETGIVIGKVVDRNNKPVKTTLIAIVPCKYPLEPVASGTARPKPPRAIAQASSGDDGLFRLGNVPVGGPFHVAVHVGPKELPAGCIAAHPGHSRNFDLKSNELVDVGTITVTFTPADGTSAAKAVTNAEPTHKGLSPARAGEEIKIPRIAGDWWQVAGTPDLGELTSPKQQAVDFSVWQAADGTWRLWSCIRNTKEAGFTRLLYCWEGAKLTDPNWKPMGIAMRADTKLGEAEGGLQAPYVFREKNLFYLAYGDWNRICLATSPDGKKFSRLLQANGQPGLFGVRGENTRDPMVLKIGDTWHCYYAAYPNNLCSVFCRTSPDLKTWSEPKQVAFGGQAGTGKYSAECPFVVELEPGQFYLFRTQRYGDAAQTSVYFSRDPLDFGVDQDEGHFVCKLPIAAPEIIHSQGQYYIAALLPSLQGIQIARLEWVSAH